MSSVDQKQRSVNLFLFFTWDVSLEIWKDKGLLQREVEYYNRLTSNGINVTFLTWGSQKDIEIGKQHCPDIKILPAYNYLFSPKSKILRALFSPFIIWFVRGTIKVQDILKTNQMWGAWVACFAKWFFKKPLIVRTGFELHHFSIMSGCNKPRAAFIGFLSKIAYKNADVIYLATEDDKKYIQRKFKIPADKIQVRPNWIDLEKFSPQDIPQKTKTLLFVGRLSEQKNIPMLIDAIAETDFQLDIYGDGELRQDLEAYAKEKRAKVQFMGAIPNSDLPKIYNSYPIYVLPSQYEGNPKTLLEAMSCGVCCIGADSDGISSLIENEINGYLCDKTVQGLRKSINEAFENEQIRQTLGQAAREYILERHKIENLLNKEIINYQEIIK